MSAKPRTNDRPKLSGKPTRMLARAAALVAREDSRAVGLWEAAGYPYDTVIGRFVRDL